MQITRDETEHDVTRFVERMAEREVAAHFLTPADQPPGVIRPPAPAVLVVTVTCPVCGTDAYGGIQPVALPFDNWRHTTCGAISAPPPAGTPDLGAVAGLPTLEMLACEWVTPRAVLPLVIAIERYGPSATGFRTRAAALVAMRAAGAARGVTKSSICDELRDLDAGESWADGVISGADHHQFALVRALAAADLVPGFVLPAATRHAAAPATWPGYREAMQPLFLGPHFADAYTPLLNGVYVAHRLDTARRALAGDAT